MSTAVAGPSTTSRSRGTSSSSWAALSCQGAASAIPSRPWEIENCRTVPWRHEPALHAQSLGMPMGTGSRCSSAFALVDLRMLVPKHQHRDPSSHLLMGTQRSALAPSFASSPPPRSGRRTDFYFWVFLLAHLLGNPFLTARLGAARAVYRHAFVILANTRPRFGEIFQALVPCVCPLQLSRAGHYQSI